MKLKIVCLIVCCTIFTLQGFCESFLSLFGGAGYAMQDNYDIGLNYGISYYKGNRNKLALGVEIINQGFNLFRDKEVNNVIGGTARMNASYLFISPMVVVQMNRMGTIQGYLNGGVGLLSGGTTKLHTWNNTPWPQGTAYDSSLTPGNNDLSTITYRVGVGLIEYCNFKGNFHIFFGQDVGILPMSFQQTNKNDPTEYNNFKGSMDEFFRPTYFTFRMGITYISHSKQTSNPGVIYR